MQITINKVVSFHYELTLDSGDMIDSSYERNTPLTFLSGNNQIIPGLEKEMMNMENGDKKSIRVAPEEAYGVRDENLIQIYPKKDLPDQIEYKKGTVLKAQNKEGHSMNVRVTNVDQDNITLDLNHPLADEFLNFKVEVTEIRDATKEEIDHGHVH